MDIAIIVLLSINCILMLLMLNAGGKNARVLEEDIIRVNKYMGKQDLLLKTYEVAAATWAVMGIKKDKPRATKPKRKPKAKGKKGNRG